MESILKGVAAVACGLMASMFVESARESLKNKIDIVVFLVTFFLIKKGHLSIPCAILIMAPLAVWYYRPKKVTDCRLQGTADQEGIDKQ